MNRGWYKINLPDDNELTWHWCVHGYSLCGKYSDCHGFKGLEFKLEGKFCSICNSGLDEQDILLYIPFETAPEKYKKLSIFDGKENFLAIISSKYDKDYVSSLIPLKLLKKTSVSITRLNNGNWIMIGGRNE